MAGIAVTILGLLIVGVFVVQAVPGIVGADASYVVLSDSMEPEISAGDAVIVKSVDPANIESGDVITFVRAEESTPVTHRVVEAVETEGGQAFRTKGDANDDPDPALVPAENVTGEVWVVLPYVGYVVMFANTPRGMALLIGLPVIAFVVSELYAFTRSDAPEEQPEPADRQHVGEFGSPAEVADDDGLVITTRDLQLSTVGFGALAVYSGYIAYQDPQPVSVGVFAGAAIVVAFVAAVFVAGREAPSTSSQPRNRQVTDGGESLPAAVGTVGSRGENDGE
ncbi:signal peptidase I [Halolamina sp. CBA1230]|uniref:signal peptidase I n=1 Tax=Halolamina sp. CBA1230 TaxID=1853690 RepID=UPI001301DAB1|nr:signal peptidase I [Halolamina sp. CBA1230]QKY21032.1 signal peptidase I [Halolamina sp. CBA1230]